MKLNYYILWVEDDDSWYETTSELFKQTIDEYGFFPIIERKKTLDEVSEDLYLNGLKNYDVFLIDFKLKNSTSGDSIIDLLRKTEIYTDVIFYSSDKQDVIDSVRENLFEGIYHSDRQEIEGKFIKVFLTTIKKIEEIDSMRGLIVGETSELDSMIEENLEKFINNDFGQNFQFDEFVNKKFFENSEKRLSKLKTQYSEGGIISILYAMDAVCKWNLLRSILKRNKTYHNMIPDFLEENKSYQKEVIDIRNKFAHAKVITDKNGKEFLKAQVGKEHFEFHEDTFREIRKKLKNHRDSLSKLSVLSN